ncbi:alcohol dehydrogenase catalytic domain-containing protein [Azospirillum sp. INR13]|uniref:alcohol dehydrogenase catalytic domain-containing protein n=1 Tax=Azospirillum sp. INR13 TaxID=2596919 RepID=UPI0021034D9D|nr:alcohol dehydrogenase catalytic domain-containing protein [Azospirillum sp. INR13]
MDDDGNPSRDGDHRSGPLALVERPVPVPETGEVLIAVEACGVCGADRGDIERADPALRRVPGHEVVGRIMALGPQVPAIWSVGQRVASAASAGTAATAGSVARASSTCAGSSRSWARPATAAMPRG